METQYRVQIGKGSKGSYKDRYPPFSLWQNAQLWYRGINIGNGYKKRLQTNKDGKWVTIAKATS